jgi:hypothetical protein
VAKPCIPIPPNHFTLHMSDMMTSCLASFPTTSDRLFLSLHPSKICIACSFFRNPSDELCRRTLFYYLPFAWQFRLFSPSLLFCCKPFFYTPRHDTYFTTKRLLLHFGSTQMRNLDCFLVRTFLLTCIFRRSEKHGFCWRYQDCCAVFCFDGEGEEEEE